MARQGKGTESLTKSALKKAKRAAAKARQDLAGVFATESAKYVNTPDLDVVDASPVQIHKKLDVVPASSLAPPSPMEQETQDKSLALPETALSQTNPLPLHPFKSLPVTTC